ncbi:MAG TPA: ABC transporter permease [Anaerolineae bacterium]
MTRYILRRLLQVPILLFGIIVFTFVLIHVAPGDPIVALAGEYGNAAYYEEMRAKFGLDRPLSEQLIIYLNNLLHGDLGYAYTYGQPVVKVILDRLPTTLLLMGTAFLVATLVGVSLGVLAAQRPYTFSDGSIMLLSLVGYALPVFWLAQLLIYLLALQMGWFPIHGMTSARERYTGFRLVLDVGHHLILPATALAVQQIALVSRLTRAGMLDALSEPYVLSARARGFTERRVLTHHALRNALLPVVTVMGGRIGFLFAGAVLTESVFAWPGLGRLLLDATLARDYPILMGMFILVSVTVILANLVTDLVYAWLDPRISYT